VRRCPPRTSFTSVDHSNDLSPNIQNTEGRHHPYQLSSFPTGPVLDYHDLARSPSNGVDTLKFPIPKQANVTFYCPGSTYTEPATVFLHGKGIYYETRIACEDLARIRKNS
jgi:hypothetical protein